MFIIFDSSQLLYLNQIFIISLIYNFKYLSCITELIIALFKEDYFRVQKLTHNEFNRFYVKNIFFAGIFLILI